MRTDGRTDEQTEIYDEADNRLRKLANAPTT
jgi:hypothetical protein